MLDASRSALYVRVQNGDGRHIGLGLTQLKMLHVQRWLWAEPVQVFHIPAVSSSFPLRSTKAFIMSSLEQMLCGMGSHKLVLDYCYLAAGQVVGVLTHCRLNSGDKPIWRLYFLLKKQVSVFLFLKSLITNSTPTHLFSVSEGDLSMVIVTAHQQSSLGKGLSET